MEVSRKGHIKAAVIAIGVVLLVSVGCVLGYHNLVLKPVEEIVLRNKKDVENTMAGQAKLNGDMVLAYSAIEEMNQNILLLDVRVKHLMENQELFLLINKEQTKMIRSIDMRELKRHLEVIRALAQLQKKHWGDPLIKESDKTIKKW